MLSNNNRLSPISVQFMYKNRQVSSRHNGTFQIEAGCDGQFVVLHFRKATGLRFVPKIVVLPTALDYIGTHVVVLQSTSGSIVSRINTQVSNTLSVSGSPDEEQSLDITLPIGSLMLPHPMRVVGNVDVYVQVQSMLTDQIAQTPGRFMYVDDDGEEGMLLMMQMITLFSNSRTPVRISGEVIMDVHLESVPQIDCVSNPNLSLMFLEDDSGTWNEVATRVNSVEQLGNVVWSTFIDITQPVSFMGVAYLVPPVDRCVLVMQLYDDAMFTNPIEDITLVDVYVLSSNDSVSLAHYVVPTHESGVTCVPVVCRMPHKLRVRPQNSESKFNFSNIDELSSKFNAHLEDDSVYITAYSPHDISDIINPVYPALMHVCEGHIDNRHALKLGRSVPIVASELYSIEPAYGELMSWYSPTRSTAENVCMMKIGVQVSAVV